MLETYQLRVNTVHDKAPTKTAIGSFGGPVDSLDENGGAISCYIHPMAEQLMDSANARHSQ